MAAVTVPGERPYAQLRTTSPAGAGTTREVILPDWTRTFTVEAPAGGNNLQVAVEGTDEGALDANYVDVIAGAGPREFIASEGRGKALITSIFVASTGASQDFVVEAEAQER